MRLQTARATGSTPQMAAIFTFGTAQFWGSAGSLHLNETRCRNGTHPRRQGYWLVASDGGMFAFGDATFEGSLGSDHLNQPIVGMAPTRDGRGYWLVASDGGIFAFGDAAFEGSLGSKSAGQPDRQHDANSRQWWLLVGEVRTGTVYAFGDADHDGSLNGWSAPATSLAAAPSGGYWILTSDGAVHRFGDSTVSSTVGQSSSVAATASTSQGPPAVTADPNVSLDTSTTSSDSAGGLSLERDRRGRRHYSNHRLQPLWSDRRSTSGRMPLQISR